MTLRRCYFDIETVSHVNPMEGGLNPRKDKILSWAMAYDDKPTEYGEWKNEVDRARLYELIYKSGPFILVAYNTKFDAQFVEQEWGPIPEMVTLQDALHICWLLDENETNYTQQYMLFKYCGIKAKGYTQYGRQKELFTEVEDVALKCKADVEHLRLLYNTRYSQLTRVPSILKVFENLYSPLIRIVMEMEQTGVCINVPKLSCLEQSYWDQMKALSNQARALGYYGGLTKTQKLSQYLFEEKGLKPRPFMLDKVRKYRMKGKPLWKCDKEILYEYMDEDPVIPIKLAHSRLATVRNLFLKKWPKLLEGDRLHPSVFQTRSCKEARGKDVENGTDSGRWSFSNPNLLQLDKESELRSCIVAPPGYKLLYADLSQAELRVMAHITKDKALVDCYKNDLDLHSITMAALGGVRRDIGKECNFSLGYGISAFKFSRRALVRSKGKLRFNTEEAQKYKDGWYGKYVGINPWKARVEKQLAVTGYVETIIKRRRRLGDMYKDKPADATRIGVNLCVQGSVADGVGIAMLDVRKNRDIRTRFLCQTYDSILLMTPDELVEQEKKVLKDCFERCLILDVPLKAMVGSGQTLQEAEKSAA